MREYDASSSTVPRGLSPNDQTAACVGLGALLGLLLGADVRTGAGRGLCGDPAYSAGRPRADVGREGGSISALPRFGVTRVGIVEYSDLGRENRHRVCDLKEGACRASLAEMK